MPVAAIPIIFNQDEGIDLSEYKRIQLDLDIDKNLIAHLLLRDIGEGEYQNKEKLKNDKNNLLINELKEEKIKLTNIKSILIINENQIKK